MAKLMFLIVPGVTDFATQCRIYAKVVDHPIYRPLADYRKEPDTWKEAGLMNNRGKLVCLTAEEAHCKEIERCEPLCAGEVFTFEVRDDYRIY